MASLWPCARALVSLGIGANGSAASAPSDNDADHSERVETVERPEPGLARGRWEAPAWVFWVLVVAALVGGAAWLGVRLRRGGRLAIRRRRPPKSR